MIPPRPHERQRLLEGERLVWERDLHSGIVQRTPYDARYPYIRDVIRKSNPAAPYMPVHLPTGADRELKRMQDKLVALGYLAPANADGVVGRSHSATLDAVRAFQGRNGLKPDRDIGGPNSDTRKALSRPVEQLQSAR